MHFNKCIELRLDKEVSKMDIREWKRRVSG